MRRFNFRERSPGRSREKEYCRKNLRQLPGEKLMQCTKSSFALNVVKGAAMMIVLLSALGAFAGTASALWGFGSVANDGNSPACNGMVFDTKGNLYGVTNSGGEYNAGVLFELSPNGQGGWTETLIHSFDPYSTSIEDG